MISFWIKPTCLRRSCYYW